MSLATVSAIALGVAGNFVYDYIKDVPVIGYIFHVLKWAYEFVTGTLNWAVKVWAVVFFGLTVYGCYYAVLFIRKRIKPPFYNYRQDTFRKWLWKWDWEYTKGKWQVANLRPYCKPCDVELVEMGDLNSSKSKCPSCERDERYQELPEEIIRLIRARVDKKAYKKEE